MLKFVVDESNQFGTLTVKIEYTDGDKKESIELPVNYYGRRNILPKEHHPLFYFSNRLFETLNRDILLDIFNTYKEIDLLFNTIWSLAALKKQLQAKCRYLVDIINLDYVNTMYIPLDTDLKIPHNIPDVFDKGKTDAILGTRNKTYIKSDYIELVGLDLILKLMIPVWGKYIHVYENELGNRHKELSAFNLIINSKILESGPYIKLKNYIGSIADKELKVLNADITQRDFQRINHHAISGISTEDMYDWLIANVCVRRLVVASVLSGPLGNTLITNVYGFAKNKLIDNTTASKKLRSKTVTDIGAISEDDKDSGLETFKIPTELSIGEEVEINHAVSDVPFMLDILAPNIDMRVVSDCINNFQTLITPEMITTTQITFTKWVMAPVINPKGLNYLDIVRLKTLFGIVQAVLWYRGHEYLSVLMTGYCVNTESGDEEIVLARTKNFNRYTTELKLELAEIFPFQRIVRSRVVKEELSETDEKIKNLVVLESIDMLTSYIINKTWNLTADTEYIKTVFGDRNRIQLPPSNIRILISKLVLEISRKDWKL